MKNNKKQNSHYIVTFLLCLVAVFGITVWNATGYRGIAVIGGSILVLFLLIYLGSRHQETSDITNTEIQLSKNRILPISTKIEKDPPLKKEAGHLIHEDFLSRDMDHMTGIEFERYCGQLLILIGYKQVLYTKASGDHGADIIASKGGYKYAIQCKCYKSTISVKAIQEALSGKMYYHADFAVVMTNSFFTKQARSDAAHLNVQLWDRKAIERMKTTAKKMALLSSDQAIYSNANKASKHAVSFANTPTDREKRALFIAKSYLDCRAFSRSGLIDQLGFEGYTSREANYAADNCGINWFDQANKCAKTYLENVPFTRQGLIEQLIYEGFTQEQADYGARTNGF